MSVIISGDNGVSDVDGSAGTPAIRGTDANTGIFFGSDIIGFSEGGTECARFNADAQFVAAAGTASLPVITTTGDTNTGIFFPAADTIAFAEGGAEAMRINSSGNVGIGTTSPGGRLTSESDGSAVNCLRLNDSRAYNASPTVAATFATKYNSSGDFVNIAYVIAGKTNTTDGNEEGYLSFGTNGNSGTTERARITSGGDFFVGTTSALTYAGKLQVYTTSGKATSLETTANEQALLTRCSNASFSNTNSLVAVDRSATSAYVMWEAYSGSGLGDREFNLRGDGNGYADGTWNNNGADYAEFFESANGQALTLGATVVLDGNKVREATDQDPASSVIGVVRPKEPSKASMVVGNTAWNKWANKYLTDDFDRYIMEDHDVVEWTDAEGKEHSYESQAIPAGITVPANATRKTHDDKGNKFQHYKLNPAWNPDSEYVNRENRPEWNIIGLLGQVKILKGQPVGDRWIKMRDVSETVEEWMIR